MSLPFFFVENLPDAGQEIQLDEENAKHIVQVLRMAAGQTLLLTDGLGRSSEAEISKAHKKSCSAKILRSQFTPHSERRSVIAISLVKNSSRFEWFLEKATELGITEIIPLICERTEKQHYRHDRFRNICVSAMLQSRQLWLPVVQAPISLSEVVAGAQQEQKFIAHCMEEDKKSLPDLFDRARNSSLILIGPEGDFTAKEVALAAEHHFTGVSLGANRLRTETAGLVAATVFAIQ